MSAWFEIIRDTLKRHEVRLVAYVPDNVLTPLIRAITEDDYFTSFVTTREEEAVGIVAGAWMGGTRGIVLMQTSGFATLPNVLASLAVPIAMGVALAQPQRRVVALEGDGSILMQLGCLATAANLKQGNLLIVVMDNGSYQITGGQATATGLGADIVAIARGAGLAQSAWAADEAHFEEMVGQALAEPGPWLIGVRIDMQKPVIQTERDPAQIRDRFMRGLGVKPAWG